MYVELHGEHGNSGKQPLEKPSADADTFQRAGRDRFKISWPDLGRLVVTPCEFDTPTRNLSKAAFSWTDCGRLHSVTTTQAWNRGEQRAHRLTFLMQPLSTFRCQPTALCAVMVDGLLIKWWYKTWRRKSSGRMPSTAGLIKSMTTE